MKLRCQLSVVILSGLFCVSTAQATGNVAQSTGVQNGGGYSSQYNPWRPQPRQWGYQGNGNRNARQAGHAQQPAYYAPPLSHIPARQHEYRQYIQQVNPYYEGYGNLPWWAGPGAAPYGPWAIGNGWPNGLW